MEDKRINDALRSVADGYISFFIKAKDNEKNNEVHDGFKAFARDVCEADYTRALDKLLEYYQEDAKIEMVWETIKSLRVELDELRLQLEDMKQQPQQEDDDIGAF